MDPLSLTANIIAVVSAASDASRLLRRIARLRNAPEELFQFQNEISDIQVVLVLVRQTSAGLGDKDTSGLLQVLGDLVRRATDTLHTFDDIMRNKLAIQANGTDVTKFSWRGWLQNVSRLRSLSADLRRIRLDMNSTLTMITASEITRTRVRLAEVALHNFNAESMLRGFEASTTEQIHAVVSSVDTMKTSIAAVQSYLSSEKKLQNTASGVRVQTSVFDQGTCNNTCPCRCHKGNKHALPEWLNPFVGKVLIGYSGIPSRSSCSEKICRPDEFCLLTVSYYFPRWFLGHCMISFRNRWTPRQGHAISVRTPRVLSSVSEPIFMAVSPGNMAALHRLFEQRLASPFDTEPQHFESVLSVIYHSFCFLHSGWNLLYKVDS